MSNTDLNRLGFHLRVIAKRASCREMPNLVIEFDNQDDKYRFIAQVINDSAVEDAMNMKAREGRFDTHGMTAKVVSKDDAPFVSASCSGESCSICKRPAAFKVEESIAFDDPNRERHPLTAYVCFRHFKDIMGQR